MIIPYKVVNILFITLYGMIIVSLSANYKCARCSVNDGFNINSSICLISSNLLVFHHKPHELLSTKSE